MFVELSDKKLQEELTTLFANSFVLKKKLWGRLFEG
jgi:hypothetical protein